MSGHSKWHTIKRKKSAQDAKRGQQFTKLANAIAVAARDGGDPDTNFRLRLAIEQAKKANMPNANIDKAIARGSGTDGGQQLQDFLYEGYGPGKAAIIVEGATDNRNRAAGQVRTAFSKNGGNLAETGAVSYQFERRGIITIEAADPDALSLAAIDAGAEDVVYDEGVVTVYTQPKQLKTVQAQLSDYTPSAVELGYVAQYTVAIDDVATAQKVIKLLEALEDIDDVANTYSNFDLIGDAAALDG